MANPKWRDVLARYRSELRPRAGRHHDRISDAAGTWLSLIAALRERGPEDGLVALRALLDRYRYASDQALRGVPDYWATPIETVAAGAGDCEDFAIAGYFALRALGVPDGSLRLVIVRMRGLPEAQSVHAVLLAQLEGGLRVLDSLRRGIGGRDDLAGYRPIYAVNGKSFWLYDRRSDRPITVAERRRVPGQAGEGAREGVQAAADLP